jgi:ferredoxin-type protein NapG
VSGVSDKEKGIKETSRRQFLADGAKAACGAALLGVAGGFGVSQAGASSQVFVRPPGAGLDSDFLASCLRCGQCVRACPHAALNVAGLFNRPATGTPYFQPREVACEMCEDLPCVKACPSGALDPELTDVTKARMGLAVLIDQETCLNYLGLRCGVCYRSCPQIDKALTLDAQHNQRSGKHTLFLPKVHSEYCTGCGKCERSCVLETPAIKVLPRDLAKGELGHHYRLGWEEKAKKGESLIPEALDLPDRMPEVILPTLPEVKP